MPINSRQKGAQGERDFAHWLTDNFGVEARRGQQFHGGTDSPDVVGIPGVHFEVKRVQNFNAYKAIDQAQNDCGSNIPIVAYRKNHKDWLFVLNAKDLKELSDIIYSLSLKEKAKIE